MTDSTDLTYRVLSACQERTPMHHLNVTWSDEDRQWVGTCDEYPSLSYLHDDPEKCGEGISELAYMVRDDIAAGRASSDEYANPTQGR